MRMGEERALVAAYGRKMSEDRLAVGTGGNLSIFDPETGLMARSEEHTS